MENKKIIVLVVIIFLAFVGYKIISSNIQENKEKAVLQEKAQLQAKEKKPLEDCLKNNFNHSIYDDSLEGILDPENSLALWRSMIKTGFEKCNTVQGNDCVLDYIYNDKRYSTIEEKRVAFRNLEQRLNLAVDEYKTNEEACYRLYK